MRLDRLELSYVCQHRSQIIEFDKGLNVIVGPNGSGKSNILKSVYAAPTNDFGRFVGAKVDQISQFASENDKSAIDLFFAHGPNSFHIHRGLRPASKFLQINNGEKITNEKEINNEIEAILGVSSKILSDYVFVAQRELFAFLEQTASVRGKAMQQLFGTYLAEVCWAALGKKINSLSSPLSITIDEDVVRQRLNDNRRKLIYLNERLKEANKIAPKHDKGWINPDEVIVDSYMRNQQITSEIEDNEANYTLVTSHKLLIKKEVDKLTKTVDSLRTIEADSRENVTKIKRNLEDWKKYKELNVKRTKLLDEKTKLVKRLTVPKPVIPLGYLDEYKNIAAEIELDRVKSEWFQAKTFLENFKDDKLTACPICGTNASNLKIKINDFRKLERELDTRMNKLEDALDQTSDYLDRLEEYERDQIVHSDKLFTIEQHLELLNDIAPPEEDEQNLNKFMASYNSVKETLKQESLNLATKTTELDKLSGQLDQIQQCINILFKELELHNISKSTFNKAKERIALVKQANTDIISIQINIDTTNELIAADIHALKEVDKVKKKLNKTNVAIKQLEQMREILHRDALPQVVAQFCLDSLVDQINEMLETFDSPFQVETTADLGFRAIFDDGRNVRAEALSGGEKAIFAIAFRVVINSTFASDIGLLCLDEPTDGLDEKNIGCLTIALDRLKQLSKSTGLQCIIITHEKSLIPYFDKVIEL